MTRPRRRARTAWCAIALLLTGGRGLAEHSSATDEAVNEGEAKRIVAIAGAGVVGLHACAYLTDLSDNIGPRVTPDRVLEFFQGL